MSKAIMEQLKENLRLPVIMAPMFLISNPKMVIEASIGGIVGTFPLLNARTGDVLEEWMVQIKNELNLYQEKHPNEKVAPWGVNFIAHRSNKRYEGDLALIKEYEPPIVITSLGDPSPVVDVVHSYGGIVLSDVINIRFAKKVIEKGSDGLILVANGAGGHAGTYNPIAFTNEVKQFFEGPIVLAGSLAKGEDILAVEKIGADMAYIGSRFIAVEESSADDAYKVMVVESTIEDIIYTDAFSGVKGNYLVPSIRQAGVDLNDLPKAENVNFDRMNRTDVKVWKDIWGAGQGVGTVNEVQSVKQVIEELSDSYQKAIEKIILKNDRKKHRI